jgi:type I pantothenate kinase
VVMDALVELVAERRREVGERPLVVGVGGPISSGKSTFAEDLAEQLRTVEALAVGVVAGDGFLFSNDELHARGLFERKGYPESYDVDGLIGFLTAVRDGRTDVVAPRYSHEAYDVVPGTEPIGDLDVVVVEGIVVLRPPLDPVVDLGIYLHAEREHLRKWYTVRFVELVAEVEDGSSSILSLFRGLEGQALRDAAVNVWEAINVPNNVEYVEPLRGRADVVVTKDAEHRLVAIERRDR